MPISDYISFDHTFKIASNIGFLRQDGRWIPEYDAVFLVLNKYGQVVIWQLTKGTSFALVRPLLQDLMERSRNQIKTIYIDDCCKLRAKIKAVFGTAVSVKLDLFHAVQRVTKTISKKHAFAQQCVQEFCLVFRYEGDNGQKRLLETPSPETICHLFVRKWENKRDSEGVCLLKQDTFSALNNLKKHDAFLVFHLVPGLTGMKGCIGT